MKSFIFSLFVIIFTVNYCEGISCKKPVCWVDNKVDKFPIQDDPKHYYQCVANLFYIKRMCLFGLHFDFNAQKCVLPSRWTDVCKDNNVEVTESPEGVNTDEPNPELPWPISCEDPKCDTPENIRVLWPAKTPRNYYECVPDGLVYKPVLRLCNDNRESHFWYFSQRCVRANEWNNICGPPQSTTTSTTTESPVTSTETPEVTTTSSTSTEEIPTTVTTEEPEPEPTTEEPEPEPTEEPEPEPTTEEPEPEPTEEPEPEPTTEEPEPEPTEEPEPEPTTEEPEPEPTTEEPEPEPTTKEPEPEPTTEEPEPEPTTEEPEPEPTTVEPEPEPTEEPEPEPTTEEPEPEPTTEEPEPEPTTEEPVPEPTTTEEPEITETTTSSSEVTSESPSPELPWPISCEDPKCDTPENIKVLWPAKTPRNYYECVPDGLGYKPVLRLCNDNRESHFWYLSQKCVRANEWNNICGPPQSTTSESPSPSTESTTTTLETTTTTPETTTTTTESTTESTTTTTESTTTTTPPTTTTTLPTTTTTLPTTTTTLPTTTTTLPTTTTTLPTTTTTLPTTTTTLPTTTSSTTTVSPGLPWPVKCDDPQCDTESNRKVLWPANTPRDYYECNGSAPVKKRCENNQISHFQYLDQKCVRANEWNNICNGKPKFFYV